MSGGKLRLGIDGRVLDDRYHGIGRVTEALLRQLAERDDVDVVVFLRAGQRSDRFDPAALIAGLRHRAAIFNQPLTSPLQWALWPPALRRAKVDIALFPYHLGAAITGSARRYAVVHDCIMEADPRFAPDRRTRLLYMLLTRMVVRRTQVLTASEASAVAIEQTYGTRRSDIGLVRWGVDPSFASPGVAKSSIDSVTLPTKYVLHVGARRPHKNVATIVAALAQMAEDQHLVLVGTVDDRVPDPVPDLARSLGVGRRLLHLPRVSDSDLLSLYAGAHAFLYPSFIEGFGLPLLEAMAAGTPVIASDIPVFREVSGDAAILVSPHDPHAWAAAVKQLDDPARREQLIAHGREAASRATWNETANQLMAILRRGRQSG